MMAGLDILIKTPEMTMQNQFALSSEFISELLADMRLRGVKYRRIQTGPSFGMGFDARPEHVYFHFLAFGKAVLRTEDGALHDLSAGSAVLMPRGQAHQILSDPDNAFENIDTFDVAPLGEAVSGVNTCPSTHPTPSAVLFYGCMEFNLGGMQGLGKLMPDVMTTSTQEHRHPGLLPILESMKREICAGRIGFAGILARLADVAAALIVRGWIEGGCENASGLVAALRDPRLARAILALHRQPGRDWNVTDMAAEARISRSAFAQRFQSTIGIPPLKYLTELRMNLARLWLSDERLSIEAAAQRLGYTSQAAFSRAFKRINGQPPGISRKA